ncbi:transposase [Chelatococcus sp. SYSU_G07232]|uniref:Transposase n=1 Tax=Chelatococcus albus TaxID=3047466 RepID=A0ABT7AHM5_9HYPH|nr:transposase [Chelatococcus sp. SYSU_G07232]MDJ1158863.1 transposase [Chelatococcus sp. SYSU_G07232]
MALQSGLTPSRYQSGEIDRDRGISKCGDAGVRWVLVEAGWILLRILKRNSSLKAWGLAVARRRAIILHRMWVDNTPYRWETKAA